MRRCADVVNEEKQIYQCGFLCLGELKISHILIIHGQRANRVKSGQFANWSQKFQPLRLGMKKPLSGFGVWSSDDFEPVKERGAEVVHIPCEILLKNPAV